MVHSTIWQDEDDLFGETKRKALGQIQFPAPTVGSPREAVAVARQRVATAAHRRPGRPDMYARRAIGPQVGPPIDIDLTSRLTRALVRRTGLWAGVDRWIDGSTRHAGPRLGRAHPKMPVPMLDSRKSAHRRAAHGSSIRLWTPTRERVLNHTHRDAH